MPRRKTATLTQVELEFMQVIWPAGEVTTEDVQNALAGEGRALADGSVRKVLGILVQKGYLSRRREGRAFLYKPTVPQGQAQRSMLLDLVKRAFGGSAALMVAALLESSTVRDKELREIKRLIAQREREGKK
jgi:BlaI family penicillinase repressor